MRFLERTKSVHGRVGTVEGHSPARRLAMDIQKAISYICFPPCKAMRKRALQFLAIIFLTAGFWILHHVGKRSSDEVKYQQWQRSIRPYATAVFLENHLPKSIGKALRLPALEDYYLHRDDKISQELLASGYLIRIQLSGTNTTQISDTLAKATKGTEAKWELGLRSMVLTCRPQDVPLLTSGLKDD